MSYNELCRTCLQEGFNYVNIFSKQVLPDGSTVLISEMIMASTSVEVLVNDDLPKHICNECLSKLSITHNFKMLVETSNRWLHENKSLLSINKLSDTANNLQTPIIKEEIKSENVIENLSFINKEDTIDKIQELECDYSLNTKTEKTKHQKSVKRKCTRKKIKSVSSKYNVPKTIKCNLCPKTFAYYYLMKSHLQSHNDKSYYCSICHKYYKSQIFHEKAHLQEKQFTCDICSKSFSTKQKILMHIQTHSKNREKPYKCKIPVCNKAYFDRNNLERHMLRHSGMKDFMCHLCSKVFIDKSGLKCHLILHNQEKKYKCQTCEECFQTPSKRYQHELRHSERKVLCQYCDLRFYTKGLLKRHMLTHTNKKRYKCSVCSASYSRNDNRRKHELTVH